MSSGVVTHMTNIEVELRKVAFQVAPLKNDPNIDDDWVNDTEMWNNNKWDSSEVEFVNLCQKIMWVVDNAVNPDSKLYLNLNLIEHAVKAIENIWAKIGAKEWNKRVPWGGNWYQFTVSAPYYLGIALIKLTTVKEMFLTQVEKFKELYINYVNHTIQSPIVGLGFVRTGTNVILQGVNFTLGKYYEGTLFSPEIYDSKGIYEMVKQLKLETVVKGDGLRPDGGWIFHNNVRSFGYLSGSIESAKILNVWFPNNYVVKYGEIAQKLCHPVINANLSGLFTRESNRVTRFMDHGVFGISHISSAKVATYKDPKYLFQMMGMSPALAFYESDQYENSWAYLWMQQRDMWLINEPVRSYNKENAKYCPGLTIFKKVLPAFPTYTGGTSQWVNKLKDSTSTILKTNDTLVTFSNMKVTTSHNAPQNNFFDKHCKYEIIICDEGGQHVVNFITDINDVLPEDYKNYISNYRLNAPDFEHSATIGTMAKVNGVRSLQLTNGLYLTSHIGDIIPKEIEFDTDKGKLKQTVFSVNFEEKKLGGALNAICNAYSLRFTDEQSEGKLPPNIYSWGNSQGFGFQLYDKYLVIVGTHTEKRYLQTILFVDLETNKGYITGNVDTKEVHASPVLSIAFGGILGNLPIDSQIKVSSFDSNPSDHYMYYDNANWILDVDYHDSSRNYVEVEYIPSGGKKIDNNTRPNSDKFDFKILNGNFATLVDPSNTEPVSEETLSQMRTKFDHKVPKNRWE